MARFSTEKQINFAIIKEMLKDNKLNIGKKPFKK